MKITYSNTRIVFSCIISCAFICGLLICVSPSHVSCIFRSACTVTVSSFPLSPSSPKRFPGINSESSTQLLIYGTQFFIINLPLLLLLIGICRRKGYMYETVARASTAPVPWVILVVVIGYVAWVVVGDDDQPLFFLPLIFLVVVLALALDLRLRNVPRYRVHGAA